MNDKDKETFEEWFKQTSNIFKDPYSERFQKNLTKQAWQAACEYKQEEIDEIKLIEISFSDLAFKYYAVQAENKKLREALEVISYQCNILAGEALKQSKPLILSEVTEDELKGLPED